jgi:23S rRNA (cytidine1920-2'-O)/16S rRNA (cytidine1409-2'-O)-methyltransferase
MSSGKRAPVGRVRLDTLLAARGLYESRSRAAASVMAGEVLLGAQRAVARKPGQLVDAEVQVALRARPRFASRGALKLAAALDRLQIDVAGRAALDVGASTGGFTDLLLQRGAAAVIALDVGYGELHWRLRSDPRVHVLERCNARHLTAAMLPYRPSLIVIDVSFISLAKVLGAVLACATERYDCLALVKPQFEAGRDAVGRGGVVRDPGVRRGALVGVGEAARTLGAAVLGFAPAGLHGPKGNRETFIWIAERGRAGALSDLEGAARAVEP